MADFPPSEFVLFSTFNRSKIEGKTDEFWAKSEWPVDQIAALHEWAVTKAEQFDNDKGETCVTISQKLLPRTSKKGNEYLLGVTTHPQPQGNTPAQGYDAEAPF